MIYKVFSRISILEVWIRILLSKFPKLKRKIKNSRKRIHIKTNIEFNENIWREYKEAIENICGNNSIVLIHSSMERLKNIGVSTKIFLDFLVSLTEKGCTIVLPAYPITNLKEPTLESNPYDPKKTPCWTGLLPNLFMTLPNVVRSEYPYNSLAALGPEAENIVRDNKKGLYVYGEYSAWLYCVNHRAKILFAGVDSLNSNTIAGHMIPDIMLDEWPIKDWYKKKIYKVKVDNKVYDKQVLVQDYAKWSKYCIDYKTDKRLIDKGLLHQKNIGGCSLGWINDSKEMVEYLIALCKKNKLMFKIPKKYYKNK